MTDKQWDKVIRKSVKHLLEAFRLREIAEKEYERRYEFHPSDKDDDWWIDTVQYGRGALNLEKIKEQAEWTKSRLKDIEDED